MCPVALASCAMARSMSIRHVWLLLCLLCLPSAQADAQYTLNLCEEALCMDAGSIKTVEDIKEGQTMSKERCTGLTAKGFGCTWGKWDDKIECRVNVCASELGIWCAKQGGMEYVCNDNTEGLTDEL